MSKSLLQKKRECYVSKSCSNLHKHHVFGGPNRKHSEKYGLWVYLRDDWHNMADYGVHFNKKLDLFLKRKAQELFENKYSHEEFMRIFKKNYLD